MRQPLTLYCEELLECEASTSYHGKSQGESYVSAMYSHCSGRYEPDTYVRCTVDRPVVFYRVNLPSVSYNGAHALERLQLVRKLALRGLLRRTLLCGRSTHRHRSEPRANMWEAHSLPGAAKGAMHRIKWVAQELRNRYKIRKLCCLR